MSFIFPAVAITLLLAYLYVHFGTVPQLASFMFGIRAGIIAVILAAVFRLSRPMFKKQNLIVIGLAVTMLNLFRFDEIILLLGAGLLSIVWEHRKRMWQKAFSLYIHDSYYHDNTLIIDLITNSPNGMTKT